ncbi:MAG: hypothetical protein ACRDNL_26765 [Spirillospora sp.]
MAKEKWRRARRSGLILSGMALVLMAVSAYPTYTYARAESKDVPLTGCTGDSPNRADCTMRWQAADGTWCEKRDEISGEDDGVDGMQNFRVNGCEVKEPYGIAFFGAGLLLLACTGIGTLVSRLRHA